MCAAVWFHATRDPMFALRILIEKCREGQRLLHCIFLDLEKNLRQGVEGETVVLYEGVWTGREVC